MKDRSLADLRPDLVREWHPTKNETLGPQDVTPGASRKIWWKCPQGDDHEWEATLGSRNQGTGCPFCSGRRADKFNNFAVKHPELLSEWDYKKNGELKPHQLTPVSGKKVWWRCPKGDDHVWESSIANRARGSGCPICAGRKIVKSNSLATLRPKLVSEWHPSKNRGLTPHNVSVSSNKRVWWKCPKGDDHEWQAMVHERSSGSACPICANRKVVNSNSLATLRPDLVLEWHLKKNGKRTPENVHPGSSFKVWWKCKHGHEWKTSLYHRSSRDTGCPSCSKRTTMPELRIYSELKNIFPSVQHRVKIKGFEVDIFIPEINVGIEYDGVFWHKKKLAADKRKNKSLSSEILLIRLRELGLPRISKYDLFLQNKSIGFVDIKNILKLILDLGISLKESTEFKIQSYFSCSSWIASKYFKQLSIQKDHIDFKESISCIHPELVEQWHPTKNEPLLPEYFTPSSHRKVWWKCPMGDDHVWKATIGSRASGHGCPICSGHKATESNCLATLFPDIAEQWHPTKNKDQTAFNVTSGSKMKAWWQCSKHESHIWQAMVKSRVRGIGCPYCSNKKVSEDNCLKASHPDIASEWHPYKNGSLTSRDITYGVGRKVWWVCIQGHEWKAYIANRTRRGDGCPQCQKTDKEDSGVQMSTFDK